MRQQITTIDRTERGVRRAGRAERDVAATGSVGNRGKRFAHQARLDGTALELLNPQPTLAGNGGTGFIADADRENGDIAAGGFGGSFQRIAFEILAV